PAGLGGRRRPGRAAVRGAGPGAAGLPAAPGAAPDGQPRTAGPAGALDGAAHRAVRREPAVRRGGRRPAPPARRRRPAAGPPALGRRRGGRTALPARTADPGARDQRGRPDRRRHRGGDPLRLPRAGLPAGLRAGRPRPAGRPGHGGAGGGDGPAGAAARRHRRRRGRTPGGCALMPEPSREPERGPRPAGPATTPGRAPPGTAHRPAPGPGTPASGPLRRSRGTRPRPVPPAPSPRDPRVPPRKRRPLPAAATAAAPPAVGAVPPPPPTESSTATMESAPDPLTRSARPALPPRPPGVRPRMRDAAPRAFRPAAVALAAGPSAERAP